MDSEITGTVLSATPRVTGSGKTVYDIAFSDGNTYATFDAKVFAKAAPLVNQQASARVSVKQNGQYTNYYLNDIAPQGQLAATTAPVATQVPLAPAISPASRGGGMTPEREQKIVKQSSFSTAFNFIASLYQGAGESELATAKEHAHSLARELYEHVMGVSTRPGPTPAPTVPEPAGVAGSPPETPGDPIPWR